MDADLRAAGVALTDPLAYTDERIHAALRVLRRQAPVHLVEAPGFDPFWAITRHADVLEVERNASVFRNVPNIRLKPKVQDVARTEQQLGIRTLVQMDAPDHGKARAIVAGWFRPMAIRELQERLARYAREYVDRLADLGGECDLVGDVATPYALQAITSMLGLPDSDRPYLRKLTEELFGGDDPELQRGSSPDDQFACLREFLSYFGELAVHRRAQPGDDLVSVIANARVDGELLATVQVASYCTNILTAGHDQASATIAGGMHALIERPSEFDRLRQDVSLLPLAVKEMIRWVTPTKTFMRTAAADYELHGRTIKAGDALLLCYLSANRDEDVIDDPFRFDVGRDPNHHIAFGYGPHRCLGEALARSQIHEFWAELLPRLELIELAGSPQLTATTWAGGLKRLPVRYGIRRQISPR